ncbi:MAG: AmpG family muropeptide MFS transporter [Rhodospirillales bacterium]|nr:AmpG family muropeptide MFS transporter [Rhodospirillales bacterium]
MLSLLFLGFSSGLPFGVLAEPLSAWLTDADVSKTQIGLFALVSIPYSLKFLWAPLVDRLPLPWLTARLGRRRGWALLAQVVLLAAIVMMGGTDPAADLARTAAFALAVAFASATQDIVIDAYRVEILEDRQLAAGAAMTVFGWRLGQVGAGALGLILADILPWPLVFTLVATMVGVGMATVLLNPEPRPAAAGEADALEARAEAFLARRPHLPRAWAAALAWTYAAAAGPIMEYVRRRHWLMILLFIALYKFGDAVLAVMKVPFFLEVGFSKTEIAEVVKLFGVAAVIAGGLIGGILLARIGILRGLLVCGVLMAASNLLFIVQAWVGPDLRMLAVTIAVENITTGMGTAAFVAYLSSLCNLAYTATQYALLTSLMALSRTVLSSGAGWLADRMTWPEFFVASTLAALPGLLLLVWMIRAFPPAESDAEEAPTKAD